MRRAAVIIGILVLTAGFTLVWFALQDPGPAHITTARDDHIPDADPHDPDHRAINNPAGDRQLNRGTARPADETADAPPDELSGVNEDDPSSRPHSPEGPRDTPVETGDNDRQPTGDSESSADAAVESARFIRGHSRPRGQNLGNVRPPARRVARSSGTKNLAEVTAGLKQDRRGLYAQFWRLEPEDVSGRDPTLPGEPDHVRIDRQVWFPDREAFNDLPFSPLGMAGVWEGFLVIDEPGDYWLFWGANKGGRIELGGETVLLQDGMVRYVEVSTVLTLEEGLHPIRIEFAQFDNGAADWEKLAANFMYVPEGESKPVPVPPEMLMVPEWMWSDKAPIITGLSQTEGEIGDEITIHGKNLYVMKPAPLGEGELEPLVSVTFAGQEAEILERSDERLKVRVPIGARTGRVTVFSREPLGFSGKMGSVQAIEWGRAVPSNSIDFTVTTRFGVTAGWHNLQSWSNFGPEALQARTPDFVRLEPALDFQADEGLGLPFQEDTLGADFDFRLGVPRDPPGRELEYAVHANSLFTLEVDGEPVEVQALPEGRFVAGFTLNARQERRVMVALKWVSEARESRLLMLSRVDRSGDEAVGQVVPGHYLFPPVVPPRPPEIHAVKPVWGDGESPPDLPYDHDPDVPSVAEGQEFTFTLRDYGPEAVWDTHPAVTVDGKRVEYVVDTEDANNARDGTVRELSCRAVMPTGVGEGRMVARLSVVDSEPVYIDIRNKGLITYLYDFPEPSGLNELPDLQSAHCFKIRKDRQINYETTADFDLPFPAETFVIEWLGGLVIEEEGDYVFTCRSDDGMKLWLDGNVIIDANHRQAPAENSSEPVRLVPGVYRFRMQFFENNQHEVCVLDWRATRNQGGVEQVIVSRQVVPPSAFTNDIHPPLPAKTSSGLRTDGSEP